MNITKSLPNSFRWSFQYFQQHPLQTLFVITVLAIRYFFAVFFIYGFWHKLVKEWMWTDVMKVHFQQRLSEIPPDSFQAAYLEHFGIPFYLPIAFVVTVGELIIGVALMLGVTTRFNAGFGLFMLLNFAAGAFYNIWIVILSAMAILIMFFPTGHWLGFDKQLHEKYPNSFWFK